MLTFADYDLKLMRMSLVQHNTKCVDHRMALEEKSRDYKKASGESECRYQI